MNNDDHPQPFTTEFDEPDETSCLDYVALLAACTDLRREIYHPDGMPGHVQVEVREYDSHLECPGYLLKKIAATRQWPAFYLMVRRKPVSWLMALLAHFPYSTTTTQCFIHLLTLQSDRDFQLCLLSQVDEWVWNDSNQNLKRHLIKHIQHIKTTGHWDSIEQNLLDDQIQWLKGKPRRVSSRRASKTGWQALFRFRRR